MAEDTPEVKNETEAKNYCKRGCGFYGSVEFKGMCSKCYQEKIKTNSTDQPNISRSNSLEHRLDPSLSSQMISSHLTCNESNSSSSVYRSLKRKVSETESIVSSAAKSVPRLNRCHWCRKRVGLTGFTCRCDGLFCSAHRYSDQHQCTFDYQAHGKLELAQANPEVRCPKIRKL